MWSMIQMKDSSPLVMWQWGLSTLYKFVLCNEKAIRAMMNLLSPPIYASACLSSRILHIQFTIGGRWGAQVKIAGQNLGACITKLPWLRWIMVMLLLCNLIYMCACQWRKAKLIISPSNMMACDYKMILVIKLLWKIKHQLLHIE